LINKAHVSLKKKKSSPKSIQLVCDQLAIALRFADFTDDFDWASLSQGYWTPHVNDSKIPDFEFGFSYTGFVS
jgi:hypothetical protein